MAYATAPITARFDLVTRMRAAAAGAAEAWTQWRLYRTTFVELSDLSDRELDDLGIARADLKRIARETTYGA
ncbi:MAG: DUF1127 domain-containing protein [Pseudomonadota bacterium]